jgi:hypothetical protein
MAPRENLTGSQSDTTHPKGWLRISSQTACIMISGTGPGTAFKNLQSDSWVELPCKTKGHPVKFYPKHRMGLHYIKKSIHYLFEIFEWLFCVFTC